MYVQSADKVKILIVDDIETNRFILKEILSDTYEIEQAEDGIKAISTLLNSIVKPKLLLLDIMMPGMNGFEVLEFMKSDPVLKKIPVIFITAADQEREGLRAGAVDYISKPFEPDIVKLRVSTQIELNLYRESLEGLVEQKANELVSTKERFLDTMAELIEYRSLESGSHVYRTRELARILLRQLLKTGIYGQILGEINYDMLIRAVPLHDIGKIGIPDNILLKPGKLTTEEFDIMKTHTTIGAQVIQSLKTGTEDDYLRHCYDISRYHHEHWDGNGYPERLSGTDIPLAARIVAVVDVYDALVSERCYKKAFSHDKAFDILEESAGTHFDPKIIGVLPDVYEQFKEQYTNNSFSPHMPNMPHIEN